jgi:hypothetical protein
MWLRNGLRGDLLEAWLHVTGPDGIPAVPPCFLFSVRGAAQFSEESSSFMYAPGWPAASAPTGSGRFALRSYRRWLRLLVFYNAHVLNEYLDAKARRHIQADYERQFKKYENLLQPKVTAVDATINIYPERRSFDGNVRITLENKTSQPIPKIHITALKQSVTNLNFDRPFPLVTSSPCHMYSIYSLEQPLGPGEIITLTCNVGHQTRGFRDGNEPAEFADNGTFFDSDYVPHIGYNTGVELDDPHRRREEHLPALEEMAQRGNRNHSMNNVFFHGESDWIAPCRLHRDRCLQRQER